MGDNDSDGKDHDSLIRIETMVAMMSERINNLASRESVARAHARIDALQKYLLGAAAVVAAQGFAIIKMLLLEK
jgi:hypothetical protein